MDPKQISEGVKESHGSPAAAPPAALSSTPAAAAPPSVERPAGGSRLKKVVLGVLGLAAVAVAVYLVIPWVWLALNTVSTDDAYVNGHFTFVAARVPGQVMEVHVDDNKPVKKGTLIVVLDKEPYQKEVDRKKADLDKAKADRNMAGADVVSLVSKAHSSRSNLDNAIDLLNSQVDHLHGEVEVLNGELATRFNAKKEYDSYSSLIKSNPGATTELIVEQKRRDYLVAKANVIKSLESIYQIRTAFGLSTKRVNAEEITRAPRELGETPADLDQTAPVIRKATSDLMQAAASLGITSSSFDLTPKQLLEEFYKRDPDPMGDPRGKLDRILQVVIKNAPTIVQANAQVAQAESNLAVALLEPQLLQRLRRDRRRRHAPQRQSRQQRPGGPEPDGHSLAHGDLDRRQLQGNPARPTCGSASASRSRWTCTAADKEFEGRITGFTMGTGQTLALLPPQNATGNFVKIVQRLPVKIELIGYDPDKRRCLSACR